MLCVCGMGMEVLLVAPDVGFALLLDGPAVMLQRLARVPVFLLQRLAMRLVFGKALLEILHLLLGDQRVCRDKGGNHT